MTTCQAFLQAYWGLNAGPSICKRSTSPTKLSPHPQEDFGCCCCLGFVFFFLFKNESKDNEVSLEG